MKENLKVLMINGSPKANGNTAIALKEMENIFKENGVEVETVVIGNKAVRGCIACGSCYEKGKCVFDDVVNEMATKFEAADGLVIASPVHALGQLVVPHSFNLLAIFCPVSGTPEALIEAGADSMHTQNLVATNGIQSASVAVYLNDHVVPDSAAGGGIGGVAFTSGRIGCSAAAGTSAAGAGRKSRDQDKSKDQAEDLAHSCLFHFSILLL